jgi:solute carrier family 35
MSAVGQTNVRLSGEMGPYQHEGQYLTRILIYYSLCSSTLLIVNKVALHLFPAPIFLLSLQLWFAVVFAYSLQALGCVHVEKLSWSTAKKFIPVVLGFMGGLFSNAKVLQYSNVETFITFRSSTPLILCVCDYVFLGRTLPSMRSLFCLVILLVSSAGYAYVDHAFDIRAYSWLAVWFASFISYEVVVKHLCDTVNLDNWTRVVYTNAMAATLLAVAVPFAPAERALVFSLRLSPFLISVVFASCLIGVGVAHSSYVMRSACSATLSAVMGIVCKVITVLINIALWDKHASVVELCFLFMGLVAGFYYEQAPVRDAKGRTSVHVDECQVGKSISDGALDTAKGGETSK